MRRRNFFALLGGAIAAPLATRAQQSPMPVVGLLHSASSSYVEDYFAPAVRHGLKETGFLEGKNVALECRAAEGRYDRLVGLMADLIGRKVAVILAPGGSEPGKAARAASATIPIVFVPAGDPVAAGLVTSLNRPGGNITGVSLLGADLEAKRLELANELVPGEAPIGALVNPKYPDADRQIRQLQEAAALLKRKIFINRASTEQEIDGVVATVARQQAGALLVAQDPFFGGRAEQFVSLAARYNLPAVYFIRNYPEIGGLASYGPDFAD